MKKINIGTVSKVLFGILLAVGVAGYLLLPWWVQGYIRWRDIKRPEYYRNILLVLYPAGLAVLTILFNAYRLMNNVSKNQAFIPQNVKLFRYMAISSVIVALVFLLSIPLIDSIFIFIIFLAFAMLAIVLVVFAQLFDSAIKYKEENELTI